MIRQEKEIKGIQSGKEEEKMSLSADDMIVYMENPIESTNKLHDKRIWQSCRIQSWYSEINGSFVHQQ